MKVVIKSLSRIVVAAGLILMSTNLNAQNQWPTSFGQASINSGYCVTIDTAQPLQEFYQISIAHLNFATATDAQKVFGAISNNYLTYRVDFDNQVAYLKIHSDRTQNLQDVIWWNNYIDSLCKE